MAEIKPLDSLYTKKLFRIPDYQRGYAWVEKQYQHFWEDLISLPENRSHYVGVLTLETISSDQVCPEDKEFWLVDDRSYRLYYIVDGQQRLTTITLFLQAFIELFRGLPENKDKADDKVYLTETLTISDVEQQYLFKENPRAAFRTYKFGYMADNPSDEYMRYRILGEPGGGKVGESFYTLNLENGKEYFKQQLGNWYENEERSSLRDIYRKLTKQFLFNEYIIEGEFDVFVAFETMNNRGKDLSKLELLKNRLIYLATLYTDEEQNPAERSDLRKTINDAWKEVYSQLGRNKSKPLNDDEFLKAHWMMYFGYSRQTSWDYIKFLLDEQFTPQRVHHKIVERVKLKKIEEQISENELETDDENGLDENGLGEIDSREPMEVAELQPNEIREYVKSLKISAAHWFSTFNPKECDNYLTQKDVEWIERLNRLGMAYFQPLVMAILKNFDDPSQRINIFKEIERFIFIMFRLNRYRSNYGESEFRGAVRKIDRGEMDLAELKSRLRAKMSFTFTDEGDFKDRDFHNFLQKEFDNGDGYFSWSGLRYFLYEYELHLLSRSRQKKVDWDDLKKNQKDKISIEHIYPQSETEAWEPAFRNISEEQRKAYRNSLGNLLVLSSAINSSLQNDSFADKKNPKYNPDGSKRRNGYADGSHSEIEVSGSEDWGPDEIRNRGKKLLQFMQKRWEIPFANDQALEKLLFIGTHDGEGTDM